MPQNDKKKNQCNLLAHVMLSRTGSGIFSNGEIRALVLGGKGPFELALSCQKNSCIGTRTWLSHYWSLYI